jgi:dTDP-4-dehydrorhamnose reductase
MNPDRWTIARTIVLYGTGENLKRSNVVLWLLQELSAGRPVYVYTDQWRSPSYALDIATGIERIVRFRKSGLFHLSARECLSVYEFAQTIARVFDLDQRLLQPVNCEERPQIAERPKRTGFIILKAETELGFRPRTLEQALTHLRSSMKLPVSSS